MAQPNILDYLAMIQKPQLAPMSSMSGDPYMPSNTSAESLLQMSLPASQQAPQLPLTSVKVPVQGSASPSSMSYAKQFDDQFRTTMDSRAQTLDALKQKLATLEATKPQGLQALNLRPFLSLADNLNGTKNEFNYNQPDVINRWKDQVNKLQEQVSKDSNGLSDDQLNYLKEKVAEEKSKAMMAQFGSLADYRKQKIAQGDDRLSINLGGKIDTDPVIKTNIEQNQNLFKAKQTLAGGMITPGVMAEIENDLAAALGGKGGATDHVRKNIEMASWERAKADIMQRLTSSPRGVNAPEYIELLNHMVDRLSEANQLSIQRRTDQLKAGVDNLSSDKAKKVAYAKIDQMNAGSSPQATPPSPDFNSMSDDELKKYLGK